MKQYFQTLLLISLSASLYAQPELRRVELSHYVFPAFVEGTVKQKSGEVNKALLNYNTITEEMIFEQAGQKLALDKLENIDTVYIQNRKFIPFANMFYEVALNTPIGLYIQHKAEIIPPGSNTGFGTSQTSAITNVSDLKAAGAAYKLRLPDEFQITSKTVYWLKKNNNYYVFRNEKNLQDLIPDKAEAIKKYAKDNKVNFKSPQDLVGIVQFCNQ